MELSENICDFYKLPTDATSLLLDNWVYSIKKYKDNISI